MILSKSGSPNVWVGDLDGNGLKQLTFTRDEASCPCWSPDGQEILYVERRGRAALRKVSVNGGESTSVHVTGPDVFGNITAPDWSPDGKQIVFTVGSGNFSILVASSAGGPAQRLAAGEDPCWAPNSRTVIFTRREGYKHVLCLLDVPTKHVKDVRQVPGSCSQPAWAR
jgi:TolB protein